MGHHSDKDPKRVILELEKYPDTVRSAFRQFSKLCILQGVRREQALADLVLPEIHANRELLERNWVDWNGLETFMLAHRFTINRVTVWHYRNKGFMDGLVRTDGVTTLYDADGILAKLQSGAMVK